MSLAQKAIIWVQDSRLQHTSILISELGSELGSCYLWAWLTILKQAWAASPNLQGEVKCYSQHKHNTHKNAWFTSMLQNIVKQASIRWRCNLQTSAAKYLLWRADCSGCKHTLDEFSLRSYEAHSPQYLLSRAIWAISAATIFALESNIRAIFEQYSSHYFSLRSTQPTIICSHNARTHNICSKSIHTQLRAWALWRLLPTIIHNYVFMLCRAQFYGMHMAIFSFVSCVLASACFWLTLTHKHAQHAIFSLQHTIPMQLPLFCVWNTPRFRFVCSSILLLYHALLPPWFS